jgi:hypothetical protein
VKHGSEGGIWIMIRARSFRLCNAWNWHTVWNLMLEIVAPAPREASRWSVSNPNMAKVRSAGEAAWPSMKFETVREK